jgi:nucleotide-binding universal stress UspA family protein
MKAGSSKKSKVQFKPIHMKKVLVALDYDQSAQMVAESGYTLARSMGASVVLLHVIDEFNFYSTEYSPIMGFSDFSSAVTPRLIETGKIREVSQKFLDSIKDHLADDTIDTVIGEGETADAILRTANEAHCDLIVMGTHSRKGIDKILMGSVAEKVMHNSLKPLFIIPIRNLRK